MAAIKSSVRSRLSQGGYDSGEGGSSDEGAERLMRAKVEESMASRKLRGEGSEGEWVGAAMSPWSVILIFPFPCL